MDIAEFLTARLDEDKLFASEAVQRQWYATDNYVDGYEGGEIAHFQIKADARHAATWSPVRVLTDVAAKRAILELHRPRVPHGYSHTLDEMTATGSAACSVCGDQGVDITTVYHPCDTLLVMARVWADHPDFNPAWTIQT